MEVTFGSVGDFIAISLLIKDFIGLLDDSRGSAWEYQALRQQLTFLRQNLDIARRFYDQHCDTTEFSHIRQALETVVDEAERRLEGVALKVRKYTSTLCQDSNKRKIQRVARKVQWSLEKKDTEKFLEDLTRYIGIIQSLQFDAFTQLMQRNFDSARKVDLDTQNLVKQLQTDLTTVTSRITIMEDEFKAVREHSERTQDYLLALGQVFTQRLDTVTQRVGSIGIVVIKGTSGIIHLGSSILRFLSTMHNSIMGLERPLHLGPIFYFEDYMGVSAVISLQFINSWDAFEGSLRGKYKGCKGGRRVAQNRFVLLNRDSGEDIDRDLLWTSAIPPGSRIAMSLVREIEENERDAQLLRCPFPSCNTLCEGVLGTVVECPSCRQLFRKLESFTDESTVPLFEAGSMRSPSDAHGPAKAKSAPPPRRGGRRMGASSPEAHESDSEDSDLVGIKRVTVRPLLRLIQSALRLNKDDNVKGHTLRPWSDGRRRKMPPPERDDARYWRTSGDGFLHPIDPHSGR